MSLKNKCPKNNHNQFYSKFEKKIRNAIIIITIHYSITNMIYENNNNMHCRTYYR